MPYTIIVMGFLILIFSMKKVFFSASVYSILEMKDDYLKITTAIKKAKAEITLDWLSDLLKINEIKDQKKISNDVIDKFMDSNKFFHKHAQAIKKSDFVIAEASSPGLGVGYQIFYAASLKKPILVLYSEEVGDLSMVRSVINFDSDLVEFRKYNDSNLDYIVDQFINKNKKEFKKFNFIISKEIDEYLNWISLYNKGKSKSALLRNKILNEIISKDKDFLGCKNTNKNKL